MSLNLSDARNISIAQNALSPAFKQVDAAIKAAAQLGNFTTTSLLVGAGNIALGPSIVLDLQLRGFTASFSTATVTVTWSA